MLLLPTLRAMGAEALPEVTAAPLILTVAFASFTVGVTVMEVVALPTLAV